MYVRMPPRFGVSSAMAPGGFIADTESATTAQNIVASRRGPTAIVASPVPPPYPAPAIFRFARWMRDPAYFSLTILAGLIANCQAALGGVISDESCGGARCI